jgi:RNA polymerase sigma factor (sigma-70 family)
MHMAHSNAEGVLRGLHDLVSSRGSIADDRQLLERFVGHEDQDAFAELVARHGPLVLGVCSRVLHDPHDADDVFQATFLVLVRKARSIRKPGSLSCYLHGVAYRLALKLKASAGRRRTHERRVTPVDARLDPDLSWREVRALIDEELLRLPATQRLPLVLCYLEGQTQDEAARQLGWSRGTLKRRLECGRERLRLRLTRRGVTLGAGLFAAAVTASTTRGAINAALRRATVTAGLQFQAGGKGVPGASRAVVLAETALRTLLPVRMKLGVILIVMLGFGVGAAGLMLGEAPAAKKADSKLQGSADRPKPGGVRTGTQKHVRKDLHGDALPDGAMARLGTLRLRHGDMTASALFTRDGKTVIVGDGRGNIVYWDVASGREIRRLGPTPGVVHALAITRDGKTLASGSWGKVFFWDVASGKALDEAQVNNDSVMQMLFTPDGKILALRDQGNTIQLWDRAGKRKLHELKGHTGHVSCIDLSPDGKTLVSGSWKDGHIRVWDVALGKEKHGFMAYDRDVVNVAFSPDGKTIVSTGNIGGLRLWDAATGEKLRQPPTFNLPMNLAFAPDGKTFAGTEGDGRLHVYDGSTGKHLRAFDAPPRTMAALAYSPDGKTIATCWGGANTFDLWDVATGKLLHADAGHRHYVTSVAFSADDATLFSAGGISDYALRAWDASTGELRGQLVESGNGYHGLALSPDGRLLAAGSYGELRLWDPATRKLVRKCLGHKETVVSVSWSADGKTLVSGSYYDKTIRVRNPATGEERRTIEAKQEWIGDVVLSPDGQTVAAGGYRDGSIRLWFTSTGEGLRTIKTSQSTVYALAFNSDGSALFSAGAAGGICLWDLSTGRLMRQWKAAPGPIYALALSHDGRSLASADFDQCARLWEVATGQEVACFRGHRGFVRTLAFSNDDRRLASGSDDTTILVWDATGTARADARLSSDQLQSLWADLLGTDSGRAWRSSWQMALAPREALPFLAERLRPVAPLDAQLQQRVEQLLVDLDQEAFAVRQQAEGELEKLGASIEPALRKALEGKPSLEVRRRIEKVLEKVAGLTGERLRTIRALAAIEHMHTPEARRLLDALAEGDPRAWLTQEAKVIRKRLER